MTFLEKALDIKRRNGIEIDPDDIVVDMCPHNLFSLNSAYCEKDSISKCRKCWNREMLDENKSILLTMDSETELNIDKKIKEQQSDYNKGLNDAWELANKVAKYTNGELSKIFGVENGIGTEEWAYSRVMKLAPQEALAKLKEYEEAQIEVGDVVETTDLIDVFNGVVLDFNDSTDDEVVVFTENGCVDVWKIADCKKTGKHIDIKAILEQIGE